MNKFKQPIKHAINLVKKNFKLPFTITIVLILLLIGIFYLITKPATPELKTEEKVNSTQVVTYSVDIPDETPITEAYTWPGTTNDPKYLSIPSANINGYIINVGVDQNNEIAVPPNVHLAGWFIETVKPGEKGLSIIDGHVDGTNIGGIFRYLTEVRVDDEFTIEMGNGTVNKFKVRDLKTVELKDAANALFSQKSGIKSQLNLITCVGTYLEDQGTYDQRLIVISEFIE